MNGRRIAALATVAIASVALAACGSKSSGNSNQPRTEMSPAAAINAAIADLATSSYAVEINPAGQQRESVTINPAARSGTLTANSEMRGIPASVDAVVVSPDIWVKVDLGSRNDEYGIPRSSWMKLDASKVSGDQSLPIDLGDFGDALDIKKLLAGLDAKRSDANHFTGVIDLTRASGVSAPSASDIASAGDKAQNIPVTVAVDQQGRLTEVNIDGGTINRSLAVDIRFSDYGTSAHVTRPDDNQVAPTPPTVYQFLSGRAG